jgi:hypothetical protein
MLKIFVYVILKVVIFAAGGIFFLLEYSKI